MSQFHSPDDEPNCPKVIKIKVDDNVKYDFNPSKQINLIDMPYQIIVHYYTKKSSKRKRN